jgi:hypothetical protein
MSWRIVKGKPLIGEVKKYDVILLPMNVNNSFNNGFRHEVAVNFPEVQKKEGETPYGDRRKFGTILTVETEGLTFILCYMFRIVRQGDDGVEYGALDECLSKAAKVIGDRRVACQLIGTDRFDGSGDKRRIAELYKTHLSDCDVTIYDYEQRDVYLDNYRRVAMLKSEIGESITRKEYRRLKNKIKWESKHGIYVPFPEEKTT